MASSSYSWGCWFQFKLGLASRRPEPSLRRRKTWWKAGRGRGWEQKQGLWEIFANPGVEYWVFFGWVLSCSVFRSRGPGQEGLNSLGESEGLVGQSCSPVFLFWQFSSAVSGFPPLLVVFPTHVCLLLSAYQTVALDGGKIWWQTLTVSVLHYHASPRIRTFLPGGRNCHRTRELLPHVWLLSGRVGTLIFSLFKGITYLTVLYPLLSCLSPGDHSATRSLVTKYMHWTPGLHVQPGNFAWAPGAYIRLPSEALNWVWNSARYLLPKPYMFSCMHACIHSLIHSFIQIVVGLQVLHSIWYQK